MISFWPRAAMSEGGKAAIRIVLGQGRSVNSPLVATRMSNPAPGLTLISEARKRMSEENAVDIFAALID
jgi:hypothetical protein